jgi:serine/threonine protein kinase
LSDLAKPVADALGGAPFGVLGSLGPNTPFAVIMKDVPGMSWTALREQGEMDPSYPPKSWPTLDVRATWAYGLATAVRNMEAKSFVHVDLQPGNVMVTAAGPTAGDMALVDFDSFIHPSNPYPDRSVQGLEGYSAPEIWRGEAVGKGSDRLGMAILIQEFLVIGDPSISRAEAFGWAYDEDKELLSKRGEPHPLLKNKYPKLAELVRQTVASPTKEGRAAPDAWRPILREIVMQNRFGPRLKNAVLIPAVGSKENIVVDLDPVTVIDLRTTPFEIRVRVERDPEGRISCLVHPGANVHVQFAHNSHWRQLQQGESTYATPGMVLLDREGKVSAKLVANLL